MLSRSSLRAAGCSALLATTLLVAVDAAADTFTVNDTSDQVDATPGNGTCATAGGTCTLRAAIQESNALAGADEVVVPAGTYALTINGVNENPSATGDLDLAGDIEVVGAGRNLTIIDASALTPRDRVFHALAGIVELRRMKITGGRHGRGAGVGNVGANLTMRNVLVEDNVATIEGGGILSSGAMTTTTINNCAIDGNRAASNGGGIANIDGSQVDVNDSSMNDNHAGDDGGGIYNRDADLHVTDSTLSLNIAEQLVFSRGGGIANVDGFAELTSATISGCRGAAGGGIYQEETEGAASLVATSVIIDGNRATGPEGGGGVFVRSGDSNLDLLTVSNNLADGTDADGGGMWMDVDSTDALSLDESSVFANSAARNGGGIALFGQANANALILRSSVYDNDAGVGGGGFFGDHPAGFNMTITKSTFSGNRADDNGAGLWLAGENNAVIDLNHVTVTANDADGTGGGVYADSSLGTFEVYHLLLAGNIAPFGADCDGDTLTSVGFNLIGDDVDCSFSAVATDIVGTAGPINPLLGPLAANGGPTLTHALQLGSPAIDAGSPMGACQGAGPTDQRGSVQPDGDCDIGAYER